MPGVTGSQRARPAATRQRQPENSVIAGPSAAAGPNRLQIGAAAPYRSRDTLNWCPSTGRGGILAAIGWNPTQIVAFCPYIKAPADIMMMAAPNTGREDVHSL